MTVLCRVCEVSRSGYYDWKGRPPSRRNRDNTRVVARIRDLHQASRETYGSPRMHHALRVKGESCGENRVARLMRVNRIQAKTVKKFKATTNSKHPYPVAKNLLGQQFSASRPNQCWVSDITYVRTREGWLYLAVVLDLYSRAVAGWAMDKRMTRRLVMDALMMGLWQRGKVKGLLLHSDRGSQYASDDYQQCLKDNGITCSMSRKGNCITTQRWRVSLAP